MKILIDAYNLALEHGTGVSTYARNLSYCLSDLGYKVGVLYGRPGSSSSTPLQREIEFFDQARQRDSWVPGILRVAGDALSSPFGYSAYEIPANGQVVRDNFAGRFPKFHSLLNSPHLYRRAHAAFGLIPIVREVSTAFKPQVAHWTYPIPLRVPGARNVYTIHDLVPLRLPFTTLDNKRYYFRLCKKIAQTADHIVTVSECSRQDIINLLGVPGERVTNTYESVRFPTALLQRAMADVADEVEASFGLKRDGYFLFFGAFEPKKNLGRLIEAYLASNVRRPLVLVGPNTWDERAGIVLPYDAYIRTLLAKGARLANGRRIVRIEYVGFPTLVSLIRCARATVFPSLYEGFGLPVLESLVLGTPVISSRTGSIPEIAGDAACLVDPYDVRAISEAIKRLDADDPLRERLAALGLARAKAFDPKLHQAKLEAIYRQVSMGLDFAPLAHAARPD